MKINELTDEDIENCIDGSTEVDLIRSILRQRFMVSGKGLVVGANFADQFAQHTQHFINEEDPVDWQLAYDNNYEWGINIASNINELILEKK